MGEARRRGTFEERKTQAIAAGRLVSIRKETLRRQTLAKQAHRDLISKLIQASSN